MKKVHNTQIMEELAYKLPLSKEVRPCWDVQTLLSLGVSNVTADVYNKRVIEKTEKIKCYIILLLFVRKNNQEKDLEESTAQPVGK